VPNTNCALTAHRFVADTRIAIHHLVRTSTADKLAVALAVQVDPLLLVFVEN
jgi:hypothetical protein